MHCTQEKINKIHYIPRPESDSSTAIVRFIPRFCRSAKIHRHTFYIYMYIHLDIEIYVCEICNKRYLIQPRKGRKSLLYTGSFFSVQYYYGHCTRDSANSFFPCHAVLQRAFQVIKYQLISRPLRRGKLYFVSQRGVFNLFSARKFRKNKIPQKAGAIVLRKFGG